MSWVQASLDELQIPRGPNNFMMGPVSPLGEAWSGFVKPTPPWESTVNSHFPYHVFLLHHNLRFNDSQVLDISLGQRLEVREPLLHFYRIEKLFDKSIASCSGLNMWRFKKPPQSEFQVSSTITPSINFNYTILVVKAGRCHDDINIVTSK